MIIFSAIKQSLARQTAIFGFCLTIAVSVPFSASLSKPFKHPFGEWREYNQAWLSVCPFDFQSEARKDSFYSRHCWAVVESAAEKNSIGYPFYSFRIYRDRINGKLDIGFIHAADRAEKIDESRPIIFTFDGKSRLEIPFGDGWRNSSFVANEYLIASSDMINELMKKMRHGAFLNVSIPVLRDGQAINHAVPLSLHGVRASESFMKKFAQP